MLKIIGKIILVLVVFMVIFFNIPTSPIRNKFKKDFEIINQSQSKSKNYKFKKTDFDTYPIAIQNYIVSNGFLGQDIMTYTYMAYKKVDFVQNKNKKLRIDYTQYNFSYKPTRIALVESKLMGIPFEGYDYYIDKKGAMIGMLAKVIKLFDERGSKMDQAALCTYLAECLFVPSSLLSCDIRFEEIDNYTVKAIIRDDNKRASGIFYFNENYEMTKFYTTDRYVVNENGTSTRTPWSANIISYQTLANGVNFPKHVQISWHYPDGDLIYFDGNINEVVFD